LESVWEFEWNKNCQLNRRIIAKLFIKWGEAKKLFEFFSHLVLKTLSLRLNSASPLTPPCFFRVIANIGNDWELVWNNNPPNNRHIVAKLFYEYFSLAVIHQ